MERKEKEKEWRKDEGSLLICWVAGERMRRVVEGGALRK